MGYSNGCVRDVVIMIHQFPTLSYKVAWGLFLKIKDYQCNFTFKNTSTASAEVRRLMCYSVWCDLAIILPANRSRFIAKNQRHNASEFLLCIRWRGSIKTFYSLSWVQWQIRSHGSSAQIGYNIRGTPALEKKPPLVTYIAITSKT